MGTFLARLGIASKIIAAIGVLTVAAVIVALVGVDALRDYNARALELNRLSDRAMTAGRINGLILSVVMDSRGVYM